MTETGKKKSVTEFLKAEYIRNVATLMIGTVAGQALVFLLSPIVFRLFTPEEITSLEQVTMMITVLSVVVTGKYEFAIMHPREKLDAIHLVALTLLVSLGVSSLLLLVALFFNRQIAEEYGNPNLAGYLWTVPVALFFTGVFNAFNYWFSRTKEYKVAARSKLYSAVAAEPLKIGFGYLSWGTAGLMLANTLGTFIAALQAYWVFVKSQPKQLFQVSKQRMKELAVLHKDYPLFSIWGSVLNRIAQWAHVGIFTAYFGLVGVGLMALSRRVLFAPLNVLSNSYSQVFFQRISEIEDVRELRSLYYKSLFRFLLFSGAMVVFIQALPNSTTSFLFGEQWIYAIHYLKVLSFWFALNFVTSNLATITYRIQMQRAGFFLDAFHFVLVLASVYYAHWRGMNEWEATQILVLAKVIYFTINILVVVAFLERYVKRQTATNV
jgi:O-antigen/teichoic acid export membrane protein